MTLNEKAVVVVESYFEHPGLSAVADVDAHDATVGWYPVTRDSLFTIEGVAAARESGVDAYSVAYGGRTADFQIDEVSP